MRLVQLADIILGDLALLGIGNEQRRTVLRSPVRTLKIQLRRVVRHREEDLQQLAVGHLFRIELHLDGFGMARRAGADGFVLRRFCVAAGITGDGALDTLHVLEDALDTPETTAGENGGLGA